MSNIDWAVPCVQIEDYPQFQWRGALLDVARHFMPKEFVKKFIDLLALHKLNSFQWHLTDDQGWRIEIKKYPKLTQIGAWRKETLVGRLEHESQKELKFDGTSHGGFYTQDDAREIVEYARVRHINVVPEIEMPGHAQAAIAAYPELGNTGHLLEVGTKWGVVENIFNPKETTILFLQDVLTEVLEMFPSGFIHTGGDEAVKTQWKASAEVQARIKELGLKNEEELQGYFTGRMAEFLSSRGRRLIGWDEILEGGVPRNATVMSWRGEKGGIAAAQAGHDVVMAPTGYTYFDYYQSRDKDKEPLAIGGYLPLETVYGYDPVPREIAPEFRKHVLGSQGQLWTEYLPYPKRVEYMAFPRLAALAEVTWTSKEKKNYAEFLERLT
ncbi:MAG: beta-N-acetylhexosaminidase, partial [Nitrospiraceae bacterium]